MQKIIIKELLIRNDCINIFQKNYKYYFGNRRVLVIKIWDNAYISGQISG